MWRRLPVSIQASLIFLLSAPVIQTLAQHKNVSVDQGSDVVLGVLEDQAGIYSGDPYFRVVRAVFQKQGNEWQPFPTDCSDAQCLKSLTRSYPQKVTWTIAFDGKDLGRVETRTPSDFRFYSEIGTEEIISPKPVPTVGNRARGFGGFTGDPVYRPLVAVSQPNYKDRYHWKPAQLSPEQIDAVRKRFRNKFPRATNCRNPEENKLIPWKYRDEDIKVTSSYSSKNGWSLVQLGLEGNRCDGYSYNDGPFIGQWYVIEPSGKLRFLGVNMWLVDAGDYDGDGGSEVLFAVSGYDLGGYRLFYRDFSRSAEFLFSYH